MYKNGAYYARNPIKWFRVSIWDFEVLVKASSRSSARYEAYLNFNDAYPMTFMDFVQQTRVVSA